MNNKALRFVILMLIIYGVWYLLYEFWISPHGAVDIFFKDLTGDHVEFWLKNLGYQALYQAQIVYIDQIPLVSIGVPCNAVPLYALYSSFILASASAKSVWWKIGFLLVGNLIIFEINVIRIFLLTLNMLYSRQSFEFNHHYLFSTVVYTLIFLMWRYWIKKFADLR